MFTSQVRKPQNSYPQLWSLQSLYLKSPKSFLDRVSTGTGSDLVVISMRYFLMILDPMV